ncbi:hypothetical protein [Planobispora rosea]|nr:hypothetical protein [Planobispora rosea]
MRVIESSWQYTATDLGQLTPEHQEKILEALEASATLRSSTARDEHGQAMRTITLVEYTSPLGIPRRAVVHHAMEGSEIVDFDDDAEAEAHYETEVRAIATAAGEPAWDECDVAGLALIPYTWTRFTRSPEGEWQLAERGCGRLGEEIDDRWARVNTVAEAADVLLDVAADRQGRDNVDAALCAAIGSPAPEAADAVRIEVTGDDGHGEHTTVVQRKVPLHTPTDQEIADFRQMMQRIDDAQRREAEEEFYAYSD